MELKHLQEDSLKAASTGAWQEAIDINKKILTLAETDLSTHLRLAYAYMQLNMWDNAKKIYHAALKIQPASQIARINLDKIKILEKENHIGTSAPSMLDPNLFINVFGKTKVIELLNVGQIQVLAKLKVGQKVIPKIKKRRIEIRTIDDEYVGVFPDDISKRLIYFLEEGSEYSMYVKETTKQSVAIFVKEDKKGKSVDKYVSFPKNVQDDLKLMHAPGEEADSDDEHSEHEEESEEETPYDIESLAEKSEDEYFSDIAVEEDEHEDFEE